MKKGFTGIISLTLALVLALLASYTTVLAGSEEKSSNIVRDILLEEKGEEFVNNYARTLELLVDFHNLFPETGARGAQYPDSFGGMYINSDGELVILLTSKYNNDMGRAAMELFDAEGLHVREVEFSHNELEAAYDLLGWLIFDSPGSRESWGFENVHGFGLDDRNNCIIIWLAEYNEENIQIFRETIFDAPFLVFELSGGLINDTGVDYPGAVEDDPVDYEEPEEDPSRSGFITPPDGPSGGIVVRPGDPLYRRDPSGIFRPAGSVGYRASMHVPGLGRRMGFVAAAHAVLNNGEMLYDNIRRHIGTVRWIQYEGVDVAFFSVENNVTASNVVVMGQLPSGVVISPQGTQIVLDARYGRGRTGFMELRKNQFQSLSGNVVDAYLGDIPHPLLVGDSGGIVYSWSFPNHVGVVGTFIGVRVSDRRAMIITADDHSAAANGNNSDRGLQAN